MAELTIEALQTLVVQPLTSRFESIDRQINAMRLDQERRDSIAVAALSDLGAAVNTRFKDTEEKQADQGLILAEHRSFINNAKWVIGTVFVVSITAATAVASNIIHLPVPGKP